MKIKKLFNDSINRYSFHFFAWAFWIISLCIFIYLQLANIFITYVDIGLGQVAFGLATLLGPTVIIPCLIFTIALTYINLAKKEKASKDFRIKETKLSQNLIYKIFITISSILSFILLGFLSCLSLAFLIKVSWGYKVFLTIGIPSLLVIFIANKILIKLLNKA